MTIVVPDSLELLGLELGFDLTCQLLFEEGGQCGEPAVYLGRIVCCRHPPEDLYLCEGCVVSSQRQPDFITCHEGPEHPSWIQNLIKL